MISRLLGWTKEKLLEDSVITYIINLPKYKSRIKKIKNKPLKEKMNVAFICQEPTVWGSFKPVYELMLKDEKINVIILVVPELVFKHYIKLEKVKHEKVYSFAKELKGDIVYTYDENEQKWIDVQALDLDYVFYSRPYETYLPKYLRASSVSKYAKICFIPYGYLCSDIFSCVYSTFFFRNAYMTFCENVDSYNYLKRKLKYTFFEGDEKHSLQKVYNTGYPKFDLTFEQSYNDSKLWKRKKQGKNARIIWTPRWTPNPKLGGSNFLNYKEVLLDMAFEREEELDFVFRPHPMTFRTFLAEGLITEQELNDFCSQIEKSNNVSLDQNQDYLELFYSSDILITDNSSVMLEYLLTHKPVILCLATEKYMGYMLHVLEAFYVVKNEEELVSTLNDLIKGVDPKKEKREEIIKELSPESSISKNIVDYIKKDYFN